VKLNTGVNPARDVALPGTVLVACCPICSTA
jgi:hypothetical protein